MSNNIILQQLIITADKKFNEDICNWLQVKQAISISILDAGDEPIYEPPPEEIILWQELKICALFANDINIDNLINQLTYDFSSEVVKHYDISNIEYNSNNLKYDFKPIAFGKKNNFWIYPYNKYPKDNLNYINLEPGLAFGSGEHPTTALCLEWLADHIAPSDKAIIDYGCGSGILGLAAVKLGLKKAYAIDNDPQAILSTNENAKRNNIADKIITFLPNDFFNIKTDYIVANILASPLIDLCPTILNYLNPNGRLILSGILQEQTDEVVLAYLSQGLKITDIKQKGAWALIAGLLR